MLSAVWNRSLELHESRNILHQFVRQQLILRYRRTALGFLWTLLNPLLMMTVSSFVFANLFRMELSSYVVFVFAGLIPWNCFNSIIVQSGSSFINNEAMLKKIYIPRMVFPLSSSLGLLVDSVLSLLALSVLALAVGAKFSAALLFLPIAYFFLFMFAFGLALITSVLIVFYRDLQHVITVGLQACFYLTPIMYKSDALVGRTAWLMSVNPIVPFITLFRDPICSGALPPVATVCTAAALAGFSLCAGLMFFFRNESKIVFRL